VYCDMLVDVLDYIELGEVWKREWKTKFYFKRSKNTFGLN
jgi:hypothetical protein